MKTKIISLLAIAFFLANSCTIEKRIHKKGYYISWNKHYRTGSPEKAKIQEVNREENHTVITESTLQEAELDKQPESKETEIDPIEHKKTSSPDLQEKTDLKLLKKVFPKKLILIPQNIAKKISPKQQETATKTLLENLAALYLIIALGLVLLGILFFFLGTISPPILDVILFVLGAICFAATIFLLVAALIMLLFNSNFKNR